MDCEIVYRIEIDGEMRREEHPSYDSAMDAARKEFQKDHALRKARLYKYTKVFMGLEITNKDYEDGNIQG